MTFEFILKRCEELGVAMTEKIAKAMVRKYGKGKDFLTSQDCSKVINRRYAKINPTKRGNTPKKGRTSVTGPRK